jgi:hypothetical protein
MSAKNVEVRMKLRKSPRSWEEIGVTSGSER